jgi:uncharacterized OB-fold protein
MVRSVVAAASYVPAHSVHGLPVGGGDEDAFTMAATAIERAARDLSLTSAEPWAIEILGRDPGPGAWAFEALLGSKVRVRTHDDRGSSLDTAMANAIDSEGPALILAVHRRNLPVPAVPETPPVGEGAIALLLGPSAKDGLPTAVASSPLPPKISGFEALKAWHRAHRNETRVRWVGDWTIEERPSLETKALRTDGPGSEALDRVSEGAILPRARYLEGLPGRWRLFGERCSGCGALGFPARGRCRRCGRGDRLTPFPFPLDGHTVLAVTRIGSGGQPTEFDAQVASTGPYEVLLAELAPGVHATFQVTDPRRPGVRIGDRVATVLRRLYALEGEWRYGRKATPMPDPGISHGESSGKPAVRGSS